MINKLLITGILVFTALCGNTAAYASTGTFTVYPSHTHNGNRNWIIRQSSPGATIEESLTLENLSDKTEQISIIVDEARAEKDKFIPLTDRPYENIGNWISLPQNSYSLAPHEKIKIPFTIAIPGQVGQRQYDAAIFAVKKEKGENGIVVVTQIGVRLYLDVTPAGTGFADVFNTSGFKNSFFFLLSLAGVAASVIYYLINHLETKNHEQRQA